MLKLLKGIVKLFQGICNNIAWFVAMTETTLIAISILLAWMKIEHPDKLKKFLFND